MEGTVTSREIVNSGWATFRQLQYWHERGVVLGRMANSKRVYDSVDVRRIMLLADISSRSTGCGLHSGRHSSLVPISKIPRAAMLCRYFLFTGRQRGKSGKLRQQKSWKLVAASDDQKETIRVAAASPHGVYLAEVPEWP